MEEKRPVGRPRKYSSNEEKKAIYKERFYTYKKTQTPKKRGRKPMSDEDKKLAAMKRYMIRLKETMESLNLTTEEAIKLLATKH